MTLADFLVERRVWKPLGDVYGGERVTHAVMGIIYGAMLANLLPVLWRWRQLPTALAAAAIATPEPLRWSLTVMAVGVFLSDLRDLYAALGLPYGGWPWSYRGRIKWRDGHDRAAEISSGCLHIAGIYNLGWGAFSALDPQWLFRFASMPLQNYPEIFACLEICHRFVRCPLISGGCPGSRTGLATGRSRAFWQNARTDWLASGIPSQKCVNCLPHREID